VNGQPWVGLRSLTAWILTCAVASAAPDASVRQNPSPPGSTRNPSAAARSRPERLPEHATAREPTDALREAGSRYERAFELYDEGAYDAALSEMKRAYELAPTFRILYNLGVMSLAVHDYAGAMQLFEQFLIEGASAIPADVRKQVSDTLGELAQRVATVSISVNAPNAELSVDDHAVAQAQRSLVVRLNAGHRRIAARAHGYLPDSKAVTLAGGDDVHVNLTLVDSPPRPSSPPPEQRGNPVPWLGFGATALLAGGAVLSGVQALAAQRDFERKRRKLDITAAALEDADARAFRWTVTTDVLAVAALGAGGYSLYLALSTPDNEYTQPNPAGSVRLDLNPTGVLITGEF
jgi:hypothetical protein